MLPRDWIELAWFTERQTAFSAEVRAAKRPSGRPHARRAPRTWEWCGGFLSKFCIFKLQVAQSINSPSLGETFRFVHTAVLSTLRFEGEGVWSSEYLEELGLLVERHGASFCEPGGRPGWR